MADGGWRGAAAVASRLTIDLAAIAANWRALDASHGGATAGVVKADAYGLSAARVAPALQQAGCQHFFVAQLGEAVALRPLVDGAMLAVLNGILPGEAEYFAEHDVVPVINNLAELALWRAEAARREQVLPAILHVETGMRRLGMPRAELKALWEEPTLLAGVALRFVMTHLVNAEQPEAPSNLAQCEAFNALARRFAPVPRSFANSSGMFLGPDYKSDLARPGAALYGVNPTPGRDNPMLPVVRLQARILQLRDVAAGETVGYNGIWTARRPSRIATLGVGYADGYLRALSNAGTARFDGAVVPLVGRVSMDLTTYDVTGTQAQVGDELELIGPGHEVDALAEEAGTNGYEILTSLGRRYARAYLE